MTKCLRGYHQPLPVQKSMEITRYGVVMLLLFLMGVSLNKIEYLGGVFPQYTAHLAGRVLDEFTPRKTFVFLSFIYQKKLNFLDQFFRHFRYSHVC